MKSNNKYVYVQELSKFVCVFLMKFTKSITKASLITSMVFKENTLQNRKTFEIFLLENILLCFPN